MEEEGEDPYNEANIEQASQAGSVLFCFSLQACRNVLYSSSMFLLTSICLVERLEDLVSLCLL